MANWLELELSIRRRSEKEAAVCAIDVQRLDDVGKSELTVRSLAIFSNAALDVPPSGYDDWIITALEEAVVILNARRNTNQAVYGPSPERHG